MKIKICGLTRLEDAKFARQYGAAALGFVCVGASPRYIPLERLRALCEALGPGCRKVGVFADAPLELIRETVKACGLDTVQLHGRESADFARAIDFARVWKAVHLTSEAELGAYRDFPAELLLLDGARGGGGKVCDWNLARQMAALRPVALAGGISFDNAAAAIAAVGPEWLDLSGSLEVSPGIKSHDKIRTFLEEYK
ncbi:MAG: N-(5'-phosphoribosyl)anthranilate isomerase [Victivallaceae bacterium]